MKKLLVTTALEETWRNDIPIVFLGDWCRLYDRKDIWEKLDHSVIPYHWDDRKKLESDYEYILDFYERILKDLSSDLNRIHNVQYSEKAWRILIGPWLGYFVQIICDRWNMIKNAVNSFHDIETIIVSLNADTMIPNDMNEFHSFYVQDKWNHFIYSKILESFNFKNIIQRPIYQSSLSVDNYKKEVKSTYKNTIKKIYNKIISLINNEKSCLFITTYLGRKNDFLLNIFFSQLPILQNSVFIKRNTIDNSLRDWIVSGDNTNNFEKFVRQIIPQQIPVVYLEGFRSLMSLSQKMGWPKYPKIIFTSNSFNSDDIFKMYLFVQNLKPIPLVIGQHGGHYGIGKIFFNEVHELKIADRYITWGWRNNGINKIIPVGKLFETKKANKIKANKNRQLFIITTTVPRYSYFLFSNFLSSQWVSYFSDLCLFIRKLEKDIQYKTTIRTFKNDFGWSQKKRWADQFPSVKLDNGEQNIHSQMKKSRIVVSTYNATTYLESLYNNFPTIIFWDPCFGEIRENALPYFDALEKVGIFHKTPQSAATHINLIWDDVDTWWNNIELQKVVKAFCNNYCKRPDNLVLSIFSELKALV